MTDDDRLVEIETKIAFQEDLTQELNKLVYEQQKKIDRLEAVCQALADHMRELTRTVAEGQRAGGAVDERPPHY
jgi:SlyX protein